MKQVHGYWLPDREERVDEFLDESIALGRPAYQHEKLEAALAITTQRRCALDIGAHVGMWTLQLLQHGFGEILAFEPDDEKHECFSRNIEEFGNQGGTVTLRQMGLGDREQRVRIVHKTATSLKTHVQPDKRGQLTIRTLDSIVGLDEVDFIKIDVEGFELFVVIGAEQTIRANWPVIVVEQKVGVASERYQVGDLDAIRLLEAWGYTIHQEMRGDFIMAPPAQIT